MNKKEISLIVAKRFYTHYLFKIENKIGDDITNLFLSLYK